MSELWRGMQAARGAEVLVRDHFCIKPGECVVVTVDTATDMAAAEAIMRAAQMAGAQPMLMLIPQLPFQGTLADPFIPRTLAEAVAQADVWFDMTFPYLAGSHMHDLAMKAGRARYLLIGDVKAGGLGRLYGTVDLDVLFETQQLFDRFVTEAEGAECRVTNAAGSDFTFTMGKSVSKKLRRTETPGMSTIMGSVIMYPVPESVRGVIALDAVFHEHYVRLPAPMRLVVDGTIREIRDAGSEFGPMDRALRRAAKGVYGHVIHVTHGFHPTARFAGESFVEDIRVAGNNAIGLGMPWWMPGGGENHPDAVLSRHSMWIGGRQVVEDGALLLS